MIARRSAAEDTPDWRRALSRAYRDPAALLDALALSPAAVGLDLGAARAFPFRVTREYAARIAVGDPADPLLLQVLPSSRETEPQPGFAADPLGETELAPRGNLLQKYHGRALLLLTGACAIHCRYCFRRSFPYAEHAGHTALAAGLAAIAADPSLEEIILSGGDPLMLDDDALAALLARLAAIPHVRRVRIHSRLPVVLPARTTPRLLELLGRQRFRVVMVVHVNHAREIDAAVSTALRRYGAAGVVVLNQAVLLRGVNDSSRALADLGTTLFEAGVLPYYVHLLDRVAGAAHFEVGAARAARLERALQRRLPGYLVPRFVREIAGAPAKVPLARATPR